MGSECNPSKPRFDITMSKRTRKPIFNQEDSYGNPRKGVVDDTDDQVDEGEDNNDHKSLKQLIKGDETSKRNSLGEHFTEEEKQLQLVKLQQQTDVQGVKLKGMVKRYVKVLSHLIKVKRNPPIASTKKSGLRLTV